VTRYVTPVDPNGRFAIQWEWKETAVLAAMDNDNFRSLLSELPSKEKVAPS
jgi:hypothetical protein